MVNNFSCHFNHWHFSFSPFTIAEKSEIKSKVSVKIKQLYVMSSLYSDDFDQYFVYNLSDSNPAYKIHWWMQFTKPGNPYSFTEGKKKCLNVP